MVVLVGQDNCFLSVEEEEEDENKQQENKIRTTM